MSAAQLKKLRDRGVLQHDSRVITAANSSMLPDRSIRHWIFTPSSGRASGQKQAFMDWSKAVQSDISYVRVLVVKNTEVKAYSEMVRGINESCKPMQQTLVMSMPDKLSLTGLTGLSDVYKEAVKDGNPDDSLAVGYSRLCIQLVAYALHLKHVWMLDDNIQDCWQLDLQAESLQGSPSKHGALQACSFDTIMRGIEEQIRNTRSTTSKPLAQLACAERYWESNRSPRRKLSPIQQGAQVRSWFDYGGSLQHYAVIGPSRQPHRYSLVGAKWPGGAGPPPFKITHSVFSFFLLNVKATMTAKEKVLWPAKQYAEDIEFHHMCEDSKLAVVKCNRFFFHKANLQGLALKNAQTQPRLSFQPAEGPMWGGQELHIQVLPQALPVTSVTICGLMATDASQRSTTWLTPALTSLVPSTVSEAFTTVMSGDVTVEIKGREPLSAQGQYVYHGMWRWPSGTTVDVHTPDAGKSIIYLLDCSILCHVHV